MTLRALPLVLRAALGDGLAFDPFVTEADAFKPLENSMKRMTTATALLLAAISTGARAQAPAEDDRIAHQSSHGVVEGVELDSNILQVGPRNRANSHAMQRRALLLRGPSRLALASCHYGNARPRRQYYRSPAARPMEGFPPAVTS